MTNKIVNDVASYYSDRLAEFGATPRGVDWNGEESQYVRFEQMSKVLPASSNAEFRVPI